MTAVIWRRGAALAAGWPATLAALLGEVVARHGRQCVLRDAALQVDWNGLDRLAAGLAGAWADRVGPGDRVLIVLPNGLPHLLAELATWRLGAVAVPLSPGLTADALRELAERVDPVLAVCSQAAHALALAAVPVLTPTDLEPMATAEPRPWTVARPEDPCLLLFTSGSTGAPRGVLLTQGNLCSQQAAFAQLWPEIGPGDRVAAHLPWHHSYGGLAERLWALCRGVELTVVPGGGRDRALLAATLRAVQPTLLMTVPKLHRLLCESGVPRGLPLRWVFTAGAALPAAVDRWYAEQGIRVHEGWGLSESSPSACITPPDEPRSPGIVGRPIPGVALGVRADGALLIEGPGVMSGYWRDPAASARVLRGGVLDSGDVGEWTPEGLRVLGRADQVFKAENGEKVIGSQIEATLEGCPGVRAALVLAHAGAAAAVLLAAPSAARAAVERQHATAPHPWYRLRQVWLPAELADADADDSGDGMTATHKLARGQLAERLRQWLRAGGDDFIEL